MTTLAQPTFDGELTPYPMGDANTTTRDAKWFLRQDRFNAKELMRQTFPPVQEVARGVISCGFVLLVAAPKSGKSWLSLQLAYEAATGGRFLGSIPVEKRPVLYLALEDGPRRLQNRMRKLGYDNNPPTSLEFIVSAASCDILETVKRFCDEHADEKPLVILDTLAKFRETVPRQSGENEYDRDSRTTGMLKDIIDECDGGCLLVVHHTRKMASGDFVETVNGSQGIAGIADEILKLTRKRNSEDGTLQLTSRDTPEGEYKVSFDSDSGMWRLDGGNLEEAAKAAAEFNSEDNTGENLRTVVRFVDAHPKGVSSPMGVRPFEVAEETDISSHHASTYLKRAVERGLIRQNGRGYYLPNEG
mgnify:CR=1 FL=1